MAKALKRVSKLNLEHEYGIPMHIMKAGDSSCVLAHNFKIWRTFFFGLGNFSQKCIPSFLDQTYTKNLNGLHSLVMEKPKDILKRV